MAETGLAAIACGRLRARIVSGELAMGQRLNDKQLAHELGISRTPMREALLLLQNEGLITIKPQSGTFVFRLSSEELRQLCETRSIMEAGAIRYGVLNTNGKTLEKLSGLIDEAEVALEARDLVRCNELDWRFHETLVASTGNMFLEKAYSSIAARLRALRHQMPQDCDRVRSAIKQHREILGLMARGAHEDAVAVLNQHVENVLTLLKKRA